MQQVVPDETQKVAQALGTLTFATSSGKDDIFSGLKSLEESKSAGRAKESVSLGALTQPKLV